MKIDWPRIYTQKDEMAAQLMASIRKREKEDKCTGSLRCTAPQPSERHHCRMLKAVYGIDGHPCRCCSGCTNRCER